MATNSKHRVRKHRQRLRDQGMRPIEIWVPDVNAPGFAEEARRQSLLANGGDAEAVQDWIDSINAGMWEEIDAQESE